MGDASARFFDDSLDPEVFVSLFTGSAGDTINALSSSSGARNGPADADINAGSVGGR